MTAVDVASEKRIPQLVTLLGIYRGNQWALGLIEFGKKAKELMELMHIILEENSFEAVSTTPFHLLHPQAIPIFGYCETKKRAFGVRVHSFWPEIYTIVPSIRRYSFDGFSTTIWPGKDRQQSRRESFKIFTGLWLLVGGLVGIFILVIIVVWAVWHSTKKWSISSIPQGKDDSKELVSEGFGCQKIPIKEIYAATNDLNALNFIGQGIAVYAIRSMEAGVLIHRIHHGVGFIYFDLGLGNKYIERRFGLLRVTATVVLIGNNISLSFDDIDANFGIQTEGIKNAHLRSKRRSKLSNWDEKNAGFGCGT
ncbi:uncharacterized protein LOC143856048 [Tasmannia lanceolata]|uniref:uncharacterized protein LOC143856048 n=1 Tax=Tasmannia lanceolata TaxID=3420 RepID=UPI0040630C8B